MLDLTSDLRRRVASSLPWETRFANLLFGLRVAVTSVPDGFGQVMMGIFHLLGVTEMEPLANPPQNLRQLDNRHVPPAYGRTLGRKAIAWGVKRLKDKEKAEEFLVAFMGDFHNKAKLGHLKSIEGKDFDQAEKILFRSMQNYLFDQYKKENRRPQNELGDVDISDRLEPFSGDVRELDEGDYNRLQKAMDDIARQIQTRWPDSGITKEDVALYVDYVTDGVSDDQIIRQKMLPFLKDRATFSPAAWTKYKQFIRERLMDELKTAGLLVRDLEEALVTASEGTLGLTSDLVEKTAGFKKTKQPFTKKEDGLWISVVQYANDEGKHKWVIKEDEGKFVLSVTIPQKGTFKRKKDFDSQEKAEKYANRFITVANGDELLEDALKKDFEKSSKTASDVTANHATVARELLEAYKLGEAEGGTSSLDVKQTAENFADYLRTTASMARRGPLGRPLGVLQKIADQAWDLAFNMGAVTIAPVTASEGTQSLTEGLIAKTALEPGTVLRLNYNAQLETLHSVFTGTAARVLYDHVLAAHERARNDPRFEDRMGFTSWDYGSPREQSGTWMCRVWIKSSPLLHSPKGEELDANLNLQIKFGDSVEVELVMGNRKSIFKKSLSGNMASPSIVGTYCADAWTELLGV